MKSTRRWPTCTPRSAGPPWPPAPARRRARPRRLRRPRLHRPPGRVIARLDDRIARDNLAKAGASQKDLEAQAKQAAVAVELARVELQRLRNLERGRGAGAGQGLELVAQVTLRKAELGLEDAEA